MFQSTRPRGARLNRSRRQSWGWRFNPRARAGRDILTCGTKSCSGCFNPRARAGRDGSKESHSGRAKCFNPRARAGRDENLSDVWEVGRVSIHAPARGATPEFIKSLPNLTSFNPRARAGRDRSRPPDAGSEPSFNPRARAGRDGISVRTSSGTNRFNPRARAGRDEDVLFRRA